jgi:hypothetical protein
MKTIVLISEDDALRARIARTLAEDERVVRSLPTGANSVVRAASEGDLVVLDCRHMERDAADGAVIACRGLVDARVCCVGIASGKSAYAVHALGQSGDHVTDVVLEGHELVPERLRAILNDSTQSASAAITFGPLAAFLSSTEMELSATVLASAGGVTNVNELSKALDEDRSALGKRLRDAGDRTPVAIVDVTVSAVAAAVLRRTRLSFKEIAKAVAGFRDSRPLNDLLERTFQARASDVREGDPGTGTEDYVGRLLADWDKRERERKKEKDDAGDGLTAE